MTTDTSQAKMYATRHTSFPANSPKPWHVVWFVLMTIGLSVSVFGWYKKGQELRRTKAVHELQLIEATKDSFFRSLRDHMNNQLEK